MFQWKVEISEQEKYRLQFREFLIKDEEKKWTFGLVNTPFYLAFTNMGALEGVSQYPKFLT
jgi:hypothetical protein